MSSPAEIPSNVHYELLSAPKNFGAKIGLLHPDSHIAITTIQAEDAELFGNDTTMLRVEDAARAGYTNLIPHIAARSTQSEGHLDELLGRAKEAGVKEIFVVGGDAEYDTNLQFPDGLSLLETMAAQGRWFESVGVGGYPVGHKYEAVTAKLDDDLRAKAEILGSLTRDAYVETEYRFKPEEVVEWMRRLQMLEIELPVQIGLLGKVGPKTAFGAAKLMRGGILEARRYMKHMGLNEANILAGKHVDMGIEVASGVAASELSGRLRGFTFNTIGAVEKTLAAFGDVHGLAAQL